MKQRQFHRQNYIDVHLGLHVQRIHEGEDQDVCVCALACVTGPELTQVHRIDRSA